MNWITVICSMIAASCLTVAGIHLLVWLRSRRAWTNLLLANCALSAAVIVGCNIALMHASSVAHSAALLRWMLRNDGLQAALGFAPATRLEDGIDAMLVAWRHDRVGGKPSAAAAGAG